MARYFLPGGADINGTGISPDRNMDFLSVSTVSEHHILSRDSRRTKNGTAAKVANKHKDRTLKPGRISGSRFSAGADFRPDYAEISNILPSILHHIR